MPLQVPALFQGIRRPPKTFLLHGPPGTGKVRSTAAV
jgi:SpoVK/Ycf46/Vps4 family AAA+-type ATPase